ncbi:MAG: hypothetical protein LW626_12730 [Verrucomicrobium sp.]|nr:hypothetical protein [Verrucomicrobium sp.]
MPMSTKASQPALQCVSTRMPSRISGAPCSPMARQWATSSSAKREAAAKARSWRSGTVPPRDIEARTASIALTGSTAVGRACFRVWYTASRWASKRSRRLPRNARAPWANP